jgi:hypothetical protein
VTDEQKAISRRAIACRGWTWGPGMLDLFGRRVRNVWPDDLGIHWSHIPESCVVRDADALPDLSDPATLGCLLALVREAWGDECVCVLPVDYGPGGVAWFCRLTAGGRDLSRTYVRGRMGEAEALVAALEAAP